MSETLTPPQAPPLPMQLMQMITGYWVTQMVAAAADLGVADHLVERPLTAEELAPRVGAHAPSLYRLLRGLTGLGIFALVDDAGRFGLTPLAELLRSDVPGSLRDMARMNAMPGHWAAWGELGHGIRTGGSPFEQAMGPGGVFAYFERNPAEAEVFNGAMTNLSRNAVPAIVGAYDFSGIKRLMDVGGGHGTLLEAILAANPGLRGVLFDLPHVAKGARAVTRAGDVAGRLEVMDGDFFQQLPTGADAILMKHILHDWDDERALAILKHCHAALPAGGKVLVVELLVPPGNGPSLAKFMDLNMLAVTSGGRERTEAEFGTLYARAGFELARLVPTPSGYFVIEGVKR